MELTGSKTIQLTDAPASRDRRGLIVAALYRCMAKKGYAATTLCDIADEAEMSSSHLLYYYPGKEAILEAFFKTVIKRIEHDLSVVEDCPAEQKVEAIADLLLSPRALRKTDQGVMLDLYGQAVQNRAMRRVKVAHDRRIKDVFVRLFSELPMTPDTTPEDAAQIAYATLFGLRANSFYDPQLTTAQANRLLKDALFRLGGIERRVQRESAAG